MCLLAAVPTTAGEVLEIGSFKGKSTVVLAKSARLAGDDRVVAPAGSLRLRLSQGSPLVSVPLAVVKNTLYFAIVAS